MAHFWIMWVSSDQRYLTNQRRHSFAMAADNTVRLHEQRPDLVRADTFAQAVNDNVIPRRFVEEDFLASTDPVRNLYLGQPQEKKREKKR
jgi:hypothetical protein